MLPTAPAHPGCYCTCYCPSSRLLLHLPPPPSSRLQEMEEARRQQQQGAPCAITRLLLLLLLLAGCGLLLVRSLGWWGHHTGLLPPAPLVTPRPLMMLNLIPQNEP